MSVLTFYYLNYNSGLLGLPPKRATFQSFQCFIFFYAFMNYLVTDRSFGSVPLLPSMLSFPSLVLLATVQPAPKCSAMPSRCGSQTIPLSPSTNKPKCIIHWICITKTKQHIILLKRLIHEEDWAHHCHLTNANHTTSSSHRIDEYYLGGKLTRGSNNTNVGRVDHFAGRKSY